MIPFSSRHCSEIQRAFLVLPGGPCARHPASGATWAYAGTEYRQGQHGAQWEHAFVHPAHPQLGGKRIELWVAAEASWAPEAQGWAEAG